MPAFGMLTCAKVLSTTQRRRITPKALIELGVLFGEGAFNLSPPQVNDLEFDTLLFLNPVFELACTALVCPDVSKPR